MAKSYVDTQTNDECTNLHNSRVTLKQMRIRLVLIVIMHIAAMNMERSIRNIMRASARLRS